MSGKLKEMQNNPDKLLCENGLWKTGYEHLGLDASHVCVHVDGKFDFMIGCHGSVHLK